MTILGRLDQLVDVNVKVRPNVKRIPRSALILRRSRQQKNFLQKLTASDTKAVALRFVLLFGVISLFADFTYEGSRSIVGPYLAQLGASGTAVGIVAGLGELLGYGLRLVSGRVAEKTGAFWPMTLFGYAIHLRPAAGAGRKLAGRPPADRRRARRTRDAQPTPRCHAVARGESDGPSA